MLYYGAAYYPEQETTEDIEQDIATMRDIGFNAVRIGEFAWSKFEPADGKYDFAWSDHAIDRLGAAGVHTLICTPSACPPAWMTEKHPEILYRDNRGVVRPHGGRRHYCYNVPVYRDYCRRMAEEMGKQYGKHPHIIGFHVDNELAQESTGRCQCQTCKQKFHQWLGAKYGTIEKFNARAGTAFWSQTYDRFEQINLPLAAIEAGGVNVIQSFRDNPLVRLDWERFCSDSIVDFCNIQADALRKFTDKPVTTNFTGYWTNGVNVYHAMERLDIPSGDIYPSGRTNDMRNATTDLAFHRGAGGKGGFWVPETTSGGGQGVWSSQGIQQPWPGALRQNAMQLFANGAELVTYFQFKMFRYGAEQLEAAVVGIDGIPDRRYREFQQAAREINRLADLLESTHVHNDVAVCFDYDSLWAIAIKPIRIGFEYRNQFGQIGAALGRHGIGVDIIPLSERIKKYKMVIVPTPVIMTDAQKALLREYVAGGGCLVTNFLGAIKTEDNAAPRAAIPAGLTDLFGMRVVEGEPVLPESTAQISLGVGDHLAPVYNQVWTESLEVQGAEPIARYANTFRASEVVATRNRFGNGSAWYLGTWFDEAALGNLLLAAASSAKVEWPPIRIEAGAEIVTRSDGQSRAYFVFNYHMENATDVELLKPLRDLLSGHELTGSVHLGPKQYLVLQA